MSGLFLAGLTILSYARARSSDPGLTTEVALLVTFLLGGLAIERPALASGLAVTVAVLLASRTWLHRFSSNILSEREVHDALVFAAAALVILPLVPNHPVGPFGVLNPHVLWRLVVLVMAISGAGYVAVRVLGPRHGLPIAGFASGFVSSKATIATLGGRARNEPALCGAAAAGAVLSTVATVVQLAIVLLAVRLSVLEAMTWPLVFAGLTAVAYGAVVAWRAARGSRPSKTAGEAERSGRAFDLRTALLFPAVVSIVLFVSAIATERLGRAGLVTATGLAGLADAHAGAISAASLVVSGRISSGEAVVPILAGLSTNTASKILVALTTGSRAFALVTIPGMVLVLLAAWSGYFVGAR